MSKIVDRGKLRREYVWKKADIIGGIVFFILCLVVCIASMIRICYVAGAAWVLFFAFFVCSAVGHLCNGVRSLKELPYVPPVREQLAALPAEEILVRGSQTSSAAPEDLLLPASRNTTPEQMLRASVEQKGQADE